MRSIFPALAAVLLTATSASAQSQPSKDMKLLFDAVQTLGTESELRGDIADRLGFGEHPLPIKDLVITANGIQHAVNAFVAGDKSYLLFDSHLYAPEIYVFVIDVNGALAAGIHGQQYEPITSAIDIAQGDAAPVIGAEEAFWLRWLAAGMKTSAPAS
jgi:hypothetical protein